MNYSIGFRTVERLDASSYLLTLGVLVEEPVDFISLDVAADSQSTVNKVAGPGGSYHTLRAVVRSKAPLGESLPKFDGDLLVGQNGTVTRCPIGSPWNNSHTAADIREAKTWR